MRTGRCSTAARLVGAALAVTTAGTALPAAAATLTPRPPRRVVQPSTLGFACSLSELDTVNVPLDAVSAPSRSTVLVAGRAPAGGSRAWALTPWGVDTASWSAAEPAAVRLDTASDGGSVLAGASGIAVYSRGTWTRTPMPDAASPARSLAALPGGAALVLQADGHLRLRRDGAWTTLAAPEDTPLAVGDVDGRPGVVTVAPAGTSARRFRVASWDGLRWVTVRTVVVAGAPAATSATTVWAARADGGVLAVNSSSAVLALVDLTNGALVPGGRLAVQGKVTGAEPVTAGRTLLAHAGPTSGGLSVYTGAASVAVPGTEGEQVTGLEQVPAERRGAAPAVVLLRSIPLAGEETTRVEICT